MTSDIEKVSSEGVRPDMRGVLPAGTTLRGYELKAILGQGGFGITYRARDTTLGRDVAVKEYLPTALAVREGRTTVVPRSADHAEQFAWGRERFLDEARTLARLENTPGIVRVHDYLEANGTAYMIMALVEGETLNKRLMREQRLTPEAVERLLFPLLDGLEEIHATGFLHRDIKPANIMVDGRGRPTLIDFGASRAAMAEHSSTLTAIFTPGYAAPEQFTAAMLGPWTDIYGLAATLYNAITGRIPPTAMERVLRDSFQPLSELQPEGYAAPLLAGIDAGLAVHIEERPQNIAEWRHRLRSEESREAAREVTRVARKAAVAPGAARGRLAAPLTIGRPALWSAAAAALVLLTGGGWFAWQTGAPASIASAVSTLSAEQLEQALADRRKADALAAEKRRLEDEARRKAEVETEAKRQAESELEQARQARQRAEEELAKLKADIEARREKEAGQREQADTAQRRAAEDAARRKAEAEAAGLRLAEEEAKRKAAADAEAKRQADEALAGAEAERQRAEQEARQKAEAEAAALKQASEETQRKAAEAERRRQAEEAQSKAEAEAAENGLRLIPADRQRLQVALSSLGFDTGGADGVFGPRSRAMIAVWQQKAGARATGFLTAPQRDQLLRSAAPAVARWDEEQRQAEDEKRKADAAKAEPAKAVAATGESTRRPQPPESGQQATTSGPILARVSVVAAPTNISTCHMGGFPATVAVRIYASKVELQMRWGWELLEVGDDGSFSGSIEGTLGYSRGNTLSVERFLIQGNVRSKDIRIVSNDYYRCVWSGKIS